jgi:ubiquinone biosynthesis protein COQ9
MNDTQRKDALLLALLPEVAFDGWTRAAMRATAARLGLDRSELDALFSKGPRDVIAWFSRWADRETLATVTAPGGQRPRVSERIALGVRTRLHILLPHREAVRRSLPLLALPGNLPLAAKLLYETVDTLWHGAGDNATDFNFYTKRGLLAGVYTATTLYWLDDRSEGMAATEAFLQRRLAEVLAIPRLKNVAARMPRFPNPLRILRAARGVSDAG